MYINMNHTQHTRTSDRHLVKDPLSLECASPIMLTGFSQIKAKKLGLALKVVGVEI